jgi:hypothetical protein
MPQGTRGGEETRDMRNKDALVTFPQDFSSPKSEYRIYRMQGYSAICTLTSFGRGS